MKIKQAMSRLIVRWRRASARKHISGWDVPTFDPDSGDLTAVRDVLAGLTETDRLKKSRILP